VIRRSRVATRNSAESIPGCNGIVSRCNRAKREAKPTPKAGGGKLSLYPLDFEVALGAVLKTGKTPDQQNKKDAVKRQSKRV
jgi:hypothetical protein